MGKTNIFCLGPTVILTNFEVFHAKCWGKNFTVNFCPCKVCAKFHVCADSQKARQSNSQTVRHLIRQSEKQLLQSVNQSINQSVSQFLKSSHQVNLTELGWNFILAPEVSFWFSLTVVNTFGVAGAILRKAW